MSKKIKGYRQRQFTTAVLAALFYGGWAFYVNIESPLVWQSTLTQFLLSFVAGYVVSASIEQLYSILNMPFKFYICAFVPYSIFLLLLLLVHYSIETQNPIKTILLNSFIGMSYFIFYTYRIKKSQI